MKITQRLDQLIPAVEQTEDSKPSRSDLVLAGCFALGVTAQAPWLAGPWLVFGVVSGLALSASVGWRRAAPVVPLVTLAVLCPCHVGVYFVNDEGLHVPGAANLAVTVIIYSVARWAAPAVVTGGAVAFAAILPIFSLVNPEEGAGFIPVELGLTALLMAGALAIRWRNAHRLQTDRANALQLRSALANEIHDSVAHHASAIALRSEATLRKLGLDHEAADDLRAIKRAAAAVVADMRSLVSVLKDPASIDLSVSAVGDLAELVATAELEGVTVDLDIAENAAHLPPSIEVIVYRLAQESITNTLKYAKAPTTIRVSLVERNEMFDLTVSDDGKPGQQTQRDHGFGLRSMAERVRGAGGVFSAGPARCGGWIVRAQLPNPASRSVRQ